MKKAKKQQKPQCEKELELSKRSRKLIDRADLKDKHQKNQID